MSVIADNLAHVRAHAGDAKVIAVSKMQTIEAIRSALIAGQRVFGENRVQEAKTKFSVLRSAFSDIELHLIGPLQTNKAEAAVELFDVIQTLDRPQLAQALASAIRKTGRHPLLYVEVNIGAEPQKSGVAPEALEEFLSYCRDVCALKISGVMCIPPQGKDPRPFFLHMRELAMQFRLHHLSMGMSADYETAIRLGATHVRVGSAIFGTRS